MSIGPDAELRVASHLEVTVVDGHGVAVMSERRRDVFAGPAYAAAIRAAQGRNEAVEADTRHAIVELTTAGVLVPRDDALGPADAAYWARDGLAPSEAAGRVARARVAVAAIGGADAGPVHDALLAAGLAVGHGDDLEVVVTDDYLSDGLAEKNADALTTGRPWLLAGSAGIETWLGPVFAPDRGPCWECLAQRMRRLRRLAEPGREQPGAERVAGAAGATGATRIAAAGMIAAQAARWLLAGHSTGIHERLLSIDARTWQTVTHTVVWRPQCPACGLADASMHSAAAPIVLAARGKLGAVEAGMRTVAAEQTARRLAHHVSPVAGIAPHVVRLPGIADPLHVYGTGSPGAMVQGEPATWPWRASMGASGKGTTDIQARAGALCEALERYSGEFGGDEPRRTATFDELGTAAIHPNAVMGVSATQYERRAELNRTASFRTTVPREFDPTAPIEWTPLWSLTAGAERFLPTAYCYFGAHVAGREMVVPDSNGNAAGNTIEEAILQGLLELVERDHVALWWYNRLSMPGVDLASFEDRWLDRVRELLAAENHRLWALDLTADLGVPVVAALSESADGSVTMGLGAHLDLHQALVRAVTELVQLRSGGSSAGLGYGPQERLDSAEAAYLRPADGVRERGPADSPMAPTGDVRADLDASTAMVEARGLEMLVLDQTRPDLGLPVVKVVVPGLRHFWPRFAPGRLYDVPVQLGHLDTPLAEAELNKVPPTP